MSTRNQQIQRLIKKFVWNAFWYRPGLRYAILDLSAKVADGKQKEEDKMARKLYTIQLVGKNGKVSLINIRAFSENHAKLISARVQERQN